MLDPAVKISSADPTVVDCYGYALLVKQVHETACRTQMIITLKMPHSLVQLMELE